MNSQPPCLVKRTLYRRRRPWRGRRSDRPVEGGSNESTRQPAGGWLGRGEGKFGGGASSAAGAAGPGGGGAAGRKGRPPGREAKERRRSSRRTMVEIEEQRALYTRAKRRGGALPDRAGLNRKRQRNGSDFTFTRTRNASMRFAKTCLGNN
jgi:hypothetical protein